MHFPNQIIHIVSACTCFAATLMASVADGASNDSAIRILNTLRTVECSGHRADAKPFKADARLNAAANYVKNGLDTREALKRADYQADQSAMIHLGGAASTAMSDAGLKRVLVNHYCKTLTDDALTEVGIASGNNELALVFAAPFTPPPPADANKIAQHVLQYVNEARTKPRKCGRKSFSPAQALSLNATLARAAQAHAKDMAAHRKMSHTGSDGSSPDERVTRVGYAWKSVGENVAMGQLSAKEVVDGWLSSPHHCENIMDPDFIHMGVAYAAVGKHETGIYWAQVFGKPK